MMNRVLDHACEIQHMFGQIGVAPSETGILVVIKEEGTLIIYDLINSDTKYEFI